MLMVLALQMCFKIEAKAVDPWYEIYLTNGQTYDVGTAKSNTTVYINSPGTYTLTGQSSKVRIVISSGDVNVYLADGLKITPGITAYVGSRTSAIYVNDQGGTVKLISKAGANVYLSSYLGTPAIRKDGTNTQLVFETEDVNNPGTITAKSAAGSKSPGIGCIGTLVGREETGNIVFNSGNVNAIGAYTAAGIGGGDGGNVNGIYINGGNITATGGSEGAGIGGQVTATGGEYGVGIGGGGPDDVVSNDGSTRVTITGGTVTAKGMVGVDIGSARNTDSTVVISGGSVKADTVKGQPTDGNGNSVYRTDITLDSLSGSMQLTEAVISKLNESYPSYGINDVYTMGDKLYFWLPESTSITAATVDDGIGTPYTGKVDAGASGTLSPCKYTIHFDPNEEAGGQGTMEDQEMVYNQSANLKLNEFTNSDSNMVFIGWKRSLALGSALYTDGATVKNLCNVSGGNVTGYTLVAQWSKVENTTLVITVDDEPVTGIENRIRLVKGEEILTPFEKMRDGDESYIPGVYVLGSEAIASGEYKIYIDEFDTGQTVEIGSGKILKNLNFYSVNTDCDSNLSTTAYSGDGMEWEGKQVFLAGSNIEVSVEEYTGEQANGYVFDQWTSLECEPAEWDASKSLTEIMITGKTSMKAISRPVNYKVNYNANTPVNISNQVSGVMETQGFIYNEVQLLQENVFTLEGYIFAGWNTKADGTGTYFVDRAMVINLSKDEQSVVELYAQWEKEEEVSPEDSEDDTEDGGKSDNAGPSEDNDMAKTDTENADTQQENADAAVDTGDGNYSWIYAIIMTVSAMIAGMIVIKKWKRRGC